MDDVGRRRVFDVMDLAHVTCDHQDPVSLEFHERGWRNETIYRDRAPADLAEDIVHLLDARDPLERNACLEEALEVNFVGVFLQEKHVLPHDKAPDGMIDRGVVIVTLVDRELKEMLWKRSDRLVVHRNGV